MSRRSLQSKLVAALASLAMVAVNAAAPSANASGSVVWLRVSGNQIQDSAGTNMTLRGVSIIVPEQNNLCGTCHTKPINELIDMTVDSSAGWYSRLLRLPVTEVHRYDLTWYHNTFIKPYVDHAIAKGLYVIIDLHYVADYGSGGIAQSTVLNFWKFIAPKYANVPNVIFEVFNEPINPSTWSSWRSYIEPVVDAIRAVAPNNLILMGSPQWSTRLNDAVNAPIEGGNIVYVYHLYPNQGPARPEIWTPGSATRPSDRGVFQGSAERAHSSVLLPSRQRGVHNGRRCGARVQAPSPQRHHAGVVADLRPPCPAPAGTAASGQLRRQLSPRPMAGRASRPRARRHGQPRRCRVRRPR